jgi:hypothetical protein
MSGGNDPNIPRSTHAFLKSARLVHITQEITEDWNAQWQTQAPNHHDAKQLRQITKKLNAL